MRSRPWGDRRRLGVAERELDDSARARADDRAVGPRRQLV